MKAVVFENGRLVCRDVPQPEPGENGVLVEIRCASVNALDYRSMRMGIIPKSRIFGADIAGVVKAVGGAVTDYFPGERVAADVSGCGLGGFAQLAAVPSGVLAKIPDAVSFEDAAALPVAGVTALQALRDKGGVQPGQSVLIVGAGGGVGTFAVQLSKHFGAKVAAVCGSGNAALMRELGADAVIDYTREDFSQGAAQYDLILAVNGGYAFSDYRRALKKGGVCVVLGGALRQVLKAMVLGPLMSAGGKRIRVLAAKTSAKDMELLLALAGQRKIKPVIEKRFALIDTAQAVEYLSQGHARGKVIVTVQEEKP